MVRSLLVLLLGAGCALERPEQVDDPAPVGTRQVTSPAPQAVSELDDGHDFGVRAEAPARCERAARTLLAEATHELAWRRLWDCVATGHFTALRELLSGAWDGELRTRTDAPLLIAQVIAMRGGNVDDDLRLVRERRVPIFGLAQAVERPGLYQGALLVVRARVSPHGLLDETRLVSQLSEVEVSPADRLVTRAPAPWSNDTRRVLTARRAYNLDVVTGRRVLMTTEDPFLDESDTAVVLARFNGLRPTDGWPVVSVLAHFAPSATVAY